MRDPNRNRLTGIGSDRWLSSPGCMSDGQSVDRRAKDIAVHW